MLCSVRSLDKLTVLQFLVTVFTHVFLITMLFSPDPGLAFPEDPDPDPGVQGSGV